MKTPGEFAFDWEVHEADGDDFSLTDAISARDAEHAAERDAMAREVEQLKAERETLIERVNAGFALERAVLDRKVEELRAKAGELEAGAVSSARWLSGLAGELERTRAKLAQAVKLIGEVVTEGYMAELIAHKVVSGLRCKEEQECFAALQAFLADVAKDSTPVEGGEGAGPDQLREDTAPAPDAPCPACFGKGAFDRSGNPVANGSPESQTTCGRCDP